MRVGRIILALLAPLVSLPALAGGSVQDSLQPQAPAMDSLLQLLRSVVPIVAAATDSEDHATAHVDRAAWPVINYLQARAGLFHAAVSPAAEANIHLLLRQQHRSLLRC
jgi:hypothetical protein